MKTHHLRKPTGRRGFTLVELLVVIVIISIVASFTLSAMQNAAELARVQRTETQVRKIHELLMDHWEEYRTRPMQIVRTSNSRPIATRKLWALRATQRMEMPDRIADLMTLTNPVTGMQDGLGATGPSSGAAPPANVPPERIFLRSAPSLWRLYRRRARNVWGNGWEGNVTLNNASSGWTVEFQDAECLYMIVASRRDGDRSALEFFQDSEIGDTDGDQMPELLDAWGMPIRFIRWAPGFVSPLQTGNILIHGTGRGQQDPPYDPFDPLRRDPRANPEDPNMPGSPNPNYHPNNVTFALYPLVYSMGPDGEDTIEANTAGDGIEGIIHDVTVPTNSTEHRNDPYAPLSTGSTVYIGHSSSTPNAAVDNIYSHLVEIR